MPRDPFDEVEDRISTALHRTGSDTVDLIRDIISIPVERVGSKTIRSKSSEPPRKESGDLWRSIAYRVPERLRLQILSDCPYRHHLRKGTPSAVDRAIESIRKNIPENIRQALKAK